MGTILPGTILSIKQWANRSIEKSGHKTKMKGEKQKIVSNFSETLTRKFYIEGKILFKILSGTNKRFMQGCPI